MLLLIFLQLKTFLVKAKVPIDDLNRELNLKIDEADHYDTFGGYILHKLGRIPKVDEEIDFKKFKAVIDNVIKQRIISVKIVKK